mmetsp:Transcript_7868/g.18747  ORF Transcript_7868/g.18747 Transcript_7868/m.18747 type:complete len:347 (+) Transcript_7868:38-1078(+)
MAGRTLHDRDALLEIVKSKDVQKIYGPPESTPIERMAGLFTASVFSWVYYLAPAYFFFVLPYLLIFRLTSLSTYVILAPMMISAALPAFKVCQPAVLGSWIMAQMPKYFDYVEVLEIDDENLAALAKQRPLILAVQPHGVFSYGGVCSAVINYSSPIRPAIVHMFPTAVASVLLSFPIMKHVLSIFGLVDASKKSMIKMCQKGKCMVLYVGGIAELFMSSSKKEAIKSRTGFIRLAMQQGADVVPLYLFGNTTALNVLKLPVLEKISRSMGASMTVFWGLFGTPCPLPKAVTYVRGKPLGLPKVENPTDEQVDEWHKKYVAEVKRIFDTYKHLNPDYANKDLTIVP